jgi:predicted ATPase
MAVFGIPTAHEDDPERAVRAALAIRQGVADGVGVRIGIESGEVVVGDPFGGATMATGDAMNVAARLEQQAQPGEIVVGANVYDAVRLLVEAEPLGDLALRGHSAPVPGWKVSAVSADVGRPRGVPGLEAPLTGRDEELALMLDAADRAKRERKAVLFTIFGVPGVGKSRLTREATARLSTDGWRVVRGRTLPYGDGITYWPLAEIVRALAGIDADMPPDDAFDRLRQLAPGADVADRLALALGIRTSGEDGAAESGAKDIAFAFRRLVESIGATTPLVLIFEDIHWAEPPMLDLIEYLATWTRDAPVLIVCPSRPELLDTRPAWGSGRMEASRISLEPLTEEESRSLLGALLTVEDLPAALRQRVLDRAEGNPLFVEEVVRMLIEGGVVVRREGHWYATKAAADVKVPDSVEALIRARLDTLPAPERVLLQAGSVVGRVFQRSAVASIAPPDQVPPPLETHLEDAILRDIITEERSPDEPTFRFRHILIRDVAYNTLPKARRAELHGAVARWLRDWSGSRIDEFVEIEAYHLEQAVLLRREIGEAVDAADREVAVRALLASARKAIARDDTRALQTFADRTIALEPIGADRLDALWFQVDALNRLARHSDAAKLAVPLERRRVPQDGASWSGAPYS